MCIKKVAVKVRNCDFQIAKIHNVVGDALRASPTSYVEAISCLNLTNNGQN